MLTATPNHTIHSARAAAEGRAMNSDEQRADRAIRIAADHFLAANPTATILPQ